MSEKFYDLLLTPGEINFAPENDIQEIFQNIITICTTIKGSRPLDRDFGVSSFILDEPVQSVTAKYNSEIISAVKKYETRAEIVKITWERINEKLTPKIRIRIKDG